MTNGWEPCNLKIMDETENIRRAMVSEINGAVESDDEKTERARLEALYGRVWNTKEMVAEFEAMGFGAPFVEVKRRSDGVTGFLSFQHRPRFYFSFTEV